MLQIAGWQLRAPSNLTRFVVLGLLSIALLVLDARGHHLKDIRATLAVLLTPLQVLAALPTRIGGWAVDALRGDQALHEELERLRAAQPLLLARMEKYEALEAENAHLRALLGTSALVADRAVAAELVEVASEPFRRTIVIAKGEKDGLYVGQPVIDAFGIRGQVSEVGALRSRAILITDPGHAIPVQVNRNGLRAIAFGTGAPDSVAIRYLTASADIREGDLLVSSGIGGSFPFGYPVARVTRVVNDANESFLDILATPVARLGHDKEVLLIWPAASVTVAPKPAAAPAPERKPIAPRKPAASAPAAVAAPPPATPAAEPAPAAPAPRPGAAPPPEADSP